MATLKKQHIVIIGCGNVAWHVAKHFSELKIFEIYVFNHKPNNLLQDFKKKLKCYTYINLNGIPSGADYYFICVNDDVIASVTSNLVLSNPNALVIHTSGSCELNLIQSTNKHKGVFYPIQTFSKSDTIHWENVPICIESTTKAGLNKLKKIGNLFSKNIFVINSIQRLNIHLAAVLVNNFTNALYAEAEHQLKKVNVDFKLLLPLIQQSGLKLNSLPPLQAQTGPAKRNDVTVIKKHLDLLQKDKEFKKIYIQLTRLIIKQQNK